MGSVLGAAGDVYYPRGFKRRLNTVPDKNRLDGDAEIDRLVNIYLSGRVNYQSWKFRREVLEATTRLLRNFQHFLNQQRTNPHLYGYNYEFLLDTLRYIETGRRRMSIQSWKGLMSEHLPPSNDFKSRSRILVDGKVPTLVKASTAEVISKWCSHKNGFEDLFQTMVVMFGRVWDPLHDVVSLHADYYNHFED